MDKEITLKETVRFRGLNAAAKKVGCSQSHLSFVMHGKRRPGPKLAKKLAKLGIIIPDIVAGDHSA